MPRSLLAKEYYEFIKWIALPLSLRSPKTQIQFAEELGVSPWTLSNWKNLPNFKDDVDRELKNWASDKTPNVIYALYKTCIEKGGASEVKLWFETFGTFKKQDYQPPVEEILSEEKKQKIMNVFKNFGFMDKEGHNTEFNANSEE